MPQIIVLSPHRHPRLRYVLAELGRELGWRFRLITEAGDWLRTGGDARISFQQGFGDGFPHLVLPQHALLSGAHPTESDLAVTEAYGMPSFFAVGDGYDYFASIFYVLSRYEEYGNTAGRDKLGRFLASGSHAQRNGYLHQPVVRIWAGHIAQQLRTVFPSLPGPAYPEFSFQPTYDIDILWAWKHRGLRGIGAGLRDAVRGQLKLAWRRLTTAEKNDPYFTLPFLEALHDRHQLRATYFWLLADTDHREDTNPYPIPARQTDWIQRLAERHRTGIHPSFESVDQEELFRTEADRLTEIVGKKTTRSRQHWLRFRLPATYRALQLAGITEEYTMGYADVVGWRAGTNRSFYWYDLEREQETGLRVHPFGAMDVTLKNYLGLHSDAAYEEVMQLARGVRPYGGAFQLLWHNSSFAVAYGWAGWRNMYVRLVRDLSAMTGRTDS